MAPTTRCAQAALVLLIYVLTATVLELHWMGSRTTAAPASSYVATPKVELQTEILVSRSAVHELQSSSPPIPASDGLVASPPAPVAHIPDPDASVSIRRKSRAATTQRPTSSDVQHPSFSSVEQASAAGCWPTPRPFFEAPFNEAFASIVWTRPMSASQGPLEDIPSRERASEWPSSKVRRLEQLLPSHDEMSSKRYNSCAVVGSSPELLLYRDGAAIDAHDAVFRANLAVTSGFEVHSGKRTTVRVVNPVESVKNARKRSQDGREMIIKNQDPPAIRSPSKEHSKFLSEAEKEPPGTPNFLARRAAIELCNFMMLASSSSASASPSPPPSAAAPATSGGKRSKRKRPRGASGAPLNMTRVTAAFREHAAGRAASWHPHGDGIPKFSPIHCSTGTVLLVQALLTCRHVHLYGYHACSCARKCTDPHIASRNHYWDKKETPRFSEMMSRYEHHMLFYQLLERACELHFRIARRDHCDRP